MKHRRDVHPNAAIQRGREADERRALLEAELRSAARVDHVATWEGRAGKVHAATQARVALKLSAREMEAKLQERRIRLAQLLHAEEEQYRAEIAALGAADSNKAARLAERARQYKEAKEMRRKEAVEKALYQKWQLESDELRLIRSQQALEAALEERAEQVVTKQALQQLEKEREMHDLERANREWAEREQKDQAVRQRQYQLSDPARTALREQIRENERLRAAQEAREEEERRQFRDKVARDEEFARQQAARAAERQKQLQQEVLEYNESVRALRQLESDREQREAQDLVQDATDAHREEIERQRAEKLRRRKEAEETQAFRAQRHLEQQAVEREVDALIQQQLDRDNERRDFLKQREELARQRLLKEVEETRWHQLEAHERQRIEAQRQRQREKEELDRELQALADEDAHRSAQRRTDAKQRAAELRRQVAELEAQQQLARRKEEDEHQQAREVEAMHRQWLQQEASKKPVRR